MIYGSYLRVADVTSRYVFATDAIWAAEEILSLALEQVSVAVNGVDMADGVDAVDKSCDVSGSDILIDSDES